MLSRICGVIDAEAFSAKGEFIIREVAIISLTTDNIYHKTFNLKNVINKSLLSKKDWSTCKYQSRFVHGLSIYPLYKEPCLDYNQLKYYISGIYSILKTKNRNVLAYKGGSIERDLLNELNIPSFNIELLGCPKYNPLQAKICKYHVKTDRQAINKIHCPIYEIQFFKQFLISTSKS